jgi:hypothetical protein
MEHDPEKLIQEWQRGLSNPGGVTPWEPGLSDSGGVPAPQPGPPEFGSPQPAPPPYGWAQPAPPPYGSAQPAPPLYAPYQLPSYGAGSTGLKFWSLLRPPRSRYRFMYIIGAVYMIAIFAFGIGSSLLHSWHPWHSNSSANGEVVHRGGSLDIGGNHESGTLGCDGGGVLYFYGNDDTFTVTGHCERVTIGGNNNRVTLDSADNIDASGINAVVTYHSGTPTVTQSGGSTVQQG